jgi:hypothetical protein
MRNSTALDELKRLAMASQAHSLDWFEPECVAFEYVEKPDADFIAACTPARILALLGEREALLRVVEAARTMRLAPVDGMAVPSQPGYWLAANKADVETLSVALGNLHALNKEAQP